jgi:hypothetical protein
MSERPDFMNSNQKCRLGYIHVLTGKITFMMRVNLKCHAKSRRRYQYKSFQELAGILGLSITLPRIGREGSNIDICQAAKANKDKVCLIFKEALGLKTEFSGSIQKVFPYLKATAVTSKL